MPLKLFAEGMSPDGVWELRALRALSNEEAAEYLQHSEHLSQFEQARHVFELVESNRDRLASAIQALEATAGLQPRERGPASRTTARAVQEVVVNYLMSVALFLEHRKRWLARTYGRESEPFKAFDSRRQNMFENDPEYRVVYELRNFVAHHGMPLQVIRTADRLVDTGTGEETRSITFVGCERDTLLREYSRWGVAESWLRKQPDEFEILPLLRRVTEKLLELERNTLRAQVPALWLSARRIVQLVAEACSLTTVGTVGELLANPEAPPSYTFRGHAPPLQTIAALQLVELLPHAPGWRIIDEHLALPYPPRMV